MTACKRRKFCLVMSYTLKPTVVCHHATLYLQCIIKSSIASCVLGIADFTICLVSSLLDFAVQADFLHVQEATFVKEHWILNIENCICQVLLGTTMKSRNGAGAVKRVGRCDAYATEFDLEAEEYVPLPKVTGFVLEVCNQIISWAS